MNFQAVVAFLLLAFLYLVRGNPSLNFRDLKPEESNYRPDLVGAATGHHGHGRVQIKVYRGPSEGHEHFAPHGYWVKQPADHHH